jgi:peptidoglycan/xylan/chitin deacetylase (PgdA/CDA1 family)
MSGRRARARSLAAHARSNVAVAMLHRFSTDPPDASWVEPRALARDLEQLREAGFTLASLRDVVAALAAGEWLPPTLVVTVDDGYADFTELAAPALAAIGCPVSIFPTSGFVDGELWFWWDQVEHVLAHGAVRDVVLELDGEAVPVDADGSTDGAPLVERLKRVPDEQLRSAITRLAELRNVEVPEAPPDRYRPTTWAALRSAPGSVEVGPHTITHPILAQVDGARATRELGESYRRVEAELGARALPVACYPNGTPDSFGDRDVAIAVACGLVGGVTATPATALPAGEPGADIYRIPRFAWSARLVQLAARPRLFGITVAAYDAARHGRSLARRG